MTKTLTVLACLLLAACAGSGRMDHSSATDVQLSHGNYHIVRQGVMGVSHGFWLLFIPIASPNYADAKADLYQAAGLNLSGRSVALANVTEDHSFFSLLLFSIPRVTITADVIEFTDAPSAHIGMVPSTNCQEVGSQLVC